LELNLRVGCWKMLETYIVRAGVRESGLT